MAKATSTKEAPRAIFLAPDGAESNTANAAKRGQRINIVVSIQS
jgi:hypothetical protein